MNKKKSLAEKNLKELCNPVVWVLVGIIAAFVSVKISSAILKIGFWESILITFVTFFVFCLFAVGVLLLWGVVEDNGGEIYPFKFLKKNANLVNDSTQPTADQPAVNPFIVAVDEPTVEEKPKKTTKKASTTKKTTDKKTTAKKPVTKKTKNVATKTETTKVKVEKATTKKTNKPTKQTKKTTKNTTKDSAKKTKKKA